MVKIERKLKELGMELPQVPMDMKYWDRCKRVGNLIFMGTTAPWPLINRGERDKMVGVIGQDRTIEEGMEIAKMCGLSMLSALKNELGDLDKIDKIVKLEVYINGGGGEVSLGKVSNAASQFFIDIFGENGRATRSVTPQNGVSNIAVELDLIVSLKD